MGRSFRVSRALVTFLSELLTFRSRLEYIDIYFFRIILYFFDERPFPRVKHLIRKILLELVNGDSSKFKFKNKSLIKFASGYPDAIFISLHNAYTICEDAAGVDV